MGRFSTANDLVIDSSGRFREYSTFAFTAANDSSFNFLPTDGIPLLNSTRVLIAARTASSSQQFSATVWMRIDGVWFPAEEYNAVFGFVRDYHTGGADRIAFTYSELTQPGTLTVRIGRSVVRTT